ncbi:MAG: MetQ/NlpA family ABC transporter substrate-binding protein [Parachlamydiaceae bacterium]
MRRSFYSIIVTVGTLLQILSSCSKSSQPTFKVAATSVPHAEILEFIQPDLKNEGIPFEILIIDDFNTQNRALVDGEVEANYFQHLPFLEAQKKDFGYALESLVAVHVEPMALYSKKYLTLTQLPKGAIIAIPSDPSNQARALNLLEESGLITLRPNGTKTGILDITANPDHLTFIELDSPLLSRSLDDVDAAVISTNFALLAGLSPQKDALAIESAHSHFANIVVIRAGEGQRRELQVLKRALTSEKTRHFIEERYQGAIIPADDQAIGSNQPVKE